MIRLAFLLLVPLSLAVAHVFHAGPMWVFVSAVLAIIPLAEWIRQATEHAAHRAGPAIGGLLNVTFGNMAELIIALFVLTAGHAEVVKAQITGSIVGNSLLGLGLAIVAGAWGREKQTFNRQQAGLLSSLLVLSVIALLVPALFDYTERGAHEAGRQALEEKLSLGVSAVLILVYVANLLYTLITHRSVFALEEDEPEKPWRRVAAGEGARRPRGGDGGGIALEAEMVSRVLEGAAERMGLSTFFLGIIVLAVVGNAPSTSRPSTSRAGTAWASS